MSSNSRYAAATVAVAAGLMLCGAASVAQTETATEATYICRVTAPNEAGDARMTKSATALTCRPFAIRMKMRDGSLKVIGNVAARPMPGPNLSTALTSQQINDAWNAWIRDTLKIPRERSD